MQNRRDGIYMTPNEVHLSRALKTIVQRIAETEYYRELSVLNSDWGLLQIRGSTRKGYLNHWTTHVTIALSYFQQPHLNKRLPAPHLKTETYTVSETLLLSFLRTPEHEHSWTPLPPSPQ
jgi:hypothetical protein